MPRTFTRIALAVTAVAALAVPSVVMARGGSDDGHEQHHNAGKVVSFDGTTLAIDRNGASTVQATVDASTELRCLTTGTTATTARHGADDPSGHDRNDDHGDDQRGDDRNHDRGDDRGRHGRHGRNHHGNRARRTVACPTSRLAAGAIVREAERSGGRWTEITLKKG